MRFRPLLFVLLFAAPALAQQQWVKFTSGTAFFVDGQGHLITNAHVVRGCQSIALHTPYGEKPAQLIASDDTRDLALLQAEASPAVAPLRLNIADLRVGDAVYVYGFPGAAGSNGTPSFARSNVTGMHGPANEPQWLQLSSVAQQGNSGGPVLDASGHVIAVISGRAETYKTPTATGAKPELIGRADIAVTLNALQDFLGSAQIAPIRENSGLLAYSETALAQQAGQYVVPVRCLQGTFVR